MQSLLQYRRIRASVQDDLAHAYSKTTKSEPSTEASTPKPESYSDGSTFSRAFDNVEKEEIWTKVPGIAVSRPAEHDGSVTFLVNWPDEDPQNPRNWSLAKKWFCNFSLFLLALAINIPASIDAPVADEFNEHYGIGPMAGTMITGMYLIGLGVGALFAGTVSETFGRNIVYVVTFVIFMLFILAKAVAPNFGSALVFRFLVGFFGSTPMTASGGSLADIWSPLEMVFAVPVTMMTAYAGPITGPIIGAYLPEIGFRWADWISLIFAGAVLTYLFLCQPETYHPLLLEWRAKHLRELTGDNRYQIGEHTTTKSLGRRLLVNIYRPFLMTYTEPIILVFTFYLTIIYFVLFTFLNGYPAIFQETYGISKSLTYILWVALLVGDGLGLPLIPIIYSWAKKAAATGELTPEVCLWYGMLGGSIALPISLWWMAWTCYVSCGPHSCVDVSLLLTQKTV